MNTALPAPRSALAALLVFAMPAVALAQEAEGVAVEYEVGVVSDYRYRGYSLSDEKPALQVGATLSEPHGWYLGAWGSTIAEYGVGADGEGAKVEIDLLAGRAFSLGAYELDVGVQAYIYPGGSNVTYLEIPVSVARTAGSWTWTAGAVYTPRQGDVVAEDDRYLFGSVAWQAPNQPWSLVARLGHDRGGFAPEGKWDWEMGAARDLGPVTVGLFYVNSDEASIDGGLVASLKAGF